MRIIKKKKDIILLKKFIILGVLSCIAVILCVAIWHKDDSNKNTEAGDKAVIIDDSISKNDIPSMYDEKILRDELLNSSSFSSYNEERLLIIKVKADEDYVYESDFLKPEEVLESDFFEKNNIDLTGKKIIGEIYSYTLEKELIGQTNIVIK